MIVYNLNTVIPTKIFVDVKNTRQWFWTHIKCNWYCCHYSIMLQNGWLGFNSQHGQKCISSTTHQDQFWRSTQTHHEADHSSLPITEVKNAWRYTSTYPYIIHLHGVMLNAQGNFLFMLNKTCPLPATIHFGFSFISDSCECEGYQAPIVICSPYCILGPLFQPSTWMSSSNQQSFSSAPHRCPATK
jgi:hypothetical protein